jgi:hypothetical protein
MQAMAKAGRQSTSISWVWLRDAYPDILKICGSPPLCESWFIEQVIAGRLRWRAKKSTAADNQKFWRNPSPTVDFAACSATRMVVAQSDAVLGFVTETLLGIEVVREDIVALKHQWPWQENPSLLAKDGSQPRRVQLECEARLDPETISSLSAEGICDALAAAGVNIVSVSAVERAFCRKA